MSGGAGSGRLARWWHAPDRWLASADDTTVCSLAVFRIWYGLFALWWWSFLRTAEAVPPTFDTEVWLLQLVPPPGATGLRVLESVLVAFLVLLTAGVITRAATAVVLVVGTYLGAVWTDLDNEQDLAILVTYVPAIMLVLDGWGDRLRLGRAWPPTPAPPDESVMDDDDAEADPGRWSAPPRVLLVVVSLLFLTAGLWKVVPGSWWTEPDTVVITVQKADVIAAVNGAPANPFSKTMVETPLVEQGIRFAVPIYEALFFLALLGPLWRRAMVAIAVVFQALNALLLAVTFTALAVVYAAWVDWSWVRSRVRVSFRAVPSPPPAFARPAAVVVALAVAVGWNTVDAARDLWSAWGLIDERSIWFVLGPVGVVALVSVPVSALLRRRAPEGGPRPGPPRARTVRPRLGAGRR